MVIELYFKILRWFRKEASIYYFNDDGSPKRCTNCGHDKLKNTTIDSIDYIECEYEITCKKCNCVMGYWAYGYFDPAYLMSYVDIGNLNAIEKTQCNGEFGECFGGCDNCTIEPITDIPIF